MQPDPCRFEGRKTVGQNPDCVDIKGQMAMVPLRFNTLLIDEAV